MNPSITLPEIPVQSVASECELMRKSQSRNSNYWAVPRTMSPGSNLAARRAGIKLAIITINAAVVIAST
jgi:hypothetical protein